MKRHLVSRRSSQSSHRTEHNDSAAVAELLEDRLFLSTSVSALTSRGKSAPLQAQTGAIVYHAPAQANPAAAGVSANATFTPAGLSPSQIRHAYGLDQIAFGAVVGSGAGQTIAIVDAYDSPTAFSDLQQFDRQFNLPDPQFTRVAQDGSTNYPVADHVSPAGSTWELETALDLQWAHSMAPLANLLLVEANSSGLDDLLQSAVNFARKQIGVSVVSMSFGGGESVGVAATYDGFLSTPNGHNGVTFVASTGDNGSPAQYPAMSVNVVGVGGTTLSLNGTGDYSSESGWSSSGGSVSGSIRQPSYQNGVVTQSSFFRAAPDVAMDADPSTGVAVYDSYDFPSSPWIQVGGTSLSAPLWGGLMAVINQGRAASGLATLNGRSETLPKLYGLPAADFHDITTGNNGHPAGAGYDLVTGLGTPVANKLVYDMVGVQPSASPVPVTISGTSGGDVIYFKRDGVNLDVWVNASQPGVGTYTTQYLISKMSSLAVAGAGGSDTLVLNASGGDFLTVPTSSTNATGTTALILIGTTAADTVSILGDSSSITFNTHSLTFSNVASIAYWDSVGGDSVETSGSIPVTLNMSGDANLTVDGGTVTINFVDAGTGPTLPAPSSQAVVKPAITQPLVISTSTATTPAARKSYRPVPRPTVRFSQKRI